MTFIEPTEEESNKFTVGQILSLPYRDEQTMRVIVIDPNGQDKGRPSLGMGFGMTEENLGLPKSTLSRWTVEGVANEDWNTSKPNTGKASTPFQASDQNTPEKVLKSPSGGFYRVLQILDETGNQQMVIEGCDWVDLACDVLETPGKVKPATLAKLNTFVRWLAKKGFYATVYAQILGAYTKTDDDAMNRRIRLLESENQTLKEKLDEMDIEYARLEYCYDRQNYIVDELKRDMHWHRMNSWS